MRLPPQCSLTKAHANEGLLRIEERTSSVRPMRTKTPPSAVYRAAWAGFWKEICRSAATSHGVMFSTLWEERGISPLCDVVRYCCSQRLVIQHLPLSATNSADSWIIERRHKIVESRLFLPVYIVVYKSYDCSSHFLHAAVDLIPFAWVRYIYNLDVIESSEERRDHSLDSRQVPCNGHNDNFARFARDPETQTVCESFRSIYSRDQDAHVRRRVLRFFGGRDRLILLA